MLRLALDTQDGAQRHGLERIFQGAYQVRRALQRGARDRVRAYWAASHARARDVAAAREKFGLSRTALEQAGYAHLDAAPHLRRQVTKALAMHLADSVWSAVERHLFRDATGRRQGLLRVGRWYDFTRLPGRARSHTIERKWETFRLHGSLAGHRAAYTGPDGDFIQPRRLRPPEGGRVDWWAYDGPLTLVFTGLPSGTLALPVRLPTAPCNQAILDYYLADPSLWHKIDLVRTRAPHAPGGWRYEAHLMVLAAPYASPATRARRAEVATAEANRVAGIDVNVSNLTIASHVAGGDLRLARIERSASSKERDAAQRRRERRRQRALERSRRAHNRAQYQLSKRQEKRARRRAAAGLSPIQVIPQGPRRSRADGVPLVAYRRDQLSIRYRRLRAEQVADAAAAAQERRDRARRLAAAVVRTHGYQFVVEDTAISAWAHTWGRGLAAFTPGLLVAAIDREARAVADAGRCQGGMSRVPTRTTALSQHCPCGARVPKSLADRIHRCSRCGLIGDRDAVSAVLGAFIVLNRPGEVASAHVDYGAALRAHADIQRLLRSPCSGWQDTRPECRGGVKARYRSD